MTANVPDWLRLKKSLTFEAERGFVNLQGKEQQFNQFLHLSFSQTPPDRISADHRRRWQQLAAEYTRYPEMTPEHRRHLVAETRRFGNRCKIRF